MLGSEIYKHKPERRGSIMPEPCDIRDCDEEETWAKALAHNLRDDQLARELEEIYPRRNRYPRSGLKRRAFLAEAARRLREDDRKR